MMNQIKTFVVALCLMQISTLVQRTEAQPVSSGAVYKSEVDELLTIATISVLPFSDNVQGIYARPLENHFNETLGKMHRWNLTPVNSVGPVLSPEELAEDLDRAKQMAGGISADAFFAARISKGPNGIAIVLSLFLTRDAKLLATATLKDGKRFDLNDLKGELDGLLNKVLAQIPYQGRIMSRDNQRVTINIGKKDGIQPSQVVSVIQLIGLTRHPKFNFLISSEKEIIGRVKILKVDDTLSFGTVVSEKEKGAVRKNAKISGLDFVNYPDTDSLDDPSGSKGLNERPDSKVSFGDNPTVWVPRKAPTFGQVGARLGNTLYNASMDVTGVGSLSSSTSLAPSVLLDGELWVTSTLSVHAGFKQGIIPIDNPRAGASPNKLNQSLTQYEFLVGYNYRFGANLWGPSVEALVGYFNYRLYVDTSAPQAYTTMNYTGIKAGVRGQFPITPDNVWSAGAEMFIIFKGRLGETPVTSGDESDNTINMFGVFGLRKITENLKGVMKLDFEQYSTNFSGAGTRTEPATSSSQRHTTLSAGVAYMF
ncbi:MAG: hypothetical protein AB7N80_05800 [Bdellovibrionales bacterium]